MNITALRRGWQIAKILRQYDLLELLPEEKCPAWLRNLDNSLFFIPRKQVDTSAATRLNLALQELGPVYVKLGQMLSTRRDLLSDDIANALALLQDQVAPFDSTLAIKEIEHALGAPIAQYFDQFDPNPLASASVAQVHTARLKDTNHDVVLKVIRPDIAPIINADLNLMEQVAKLVASTAIGQRLRPVEVFNDYKKTLLNELDLTMEAANAVQLKHNFDGSEALFVPQVYPELCHTNLLVMERIYGIPVSDMAALEAQGTNMKLLADRGVEVFFTQVFRDNFFHADMHPGNIFISRENPENPKYISIDCGIVGRLSEQDKRDLAEIFLAFFNRNYHKLTRVFMNGGWVDHDADPVAFEHALRQVLSPLENKPLAEISFGHLLVELFRTARTFGMIVKPQLVLLEKTLLYIEGLGRQLYPQLDLWQTAKPFLEHWMQDQVSVKAQWQKIQEISPFFMEKIPEIPELLHDNLTLSQQLMSNSQRILDQYSTQQIAQHRSSLLTSMGGVMILTSALLLDKTNDQWPSVLLATGGILFWLISWRIRKP